MSAWKCSEKDCDFVDHGELRLSGERSYDKMLAHKEVHLPLEKRQELERIKNPEKYKKTYSGVDAFLTGDRTESGDVRTATTPVDRGTDSRRAPNSSDSTVSDTVRSLSRD